VAVWGILIRLLFQHGAFDAHSSVLTNWALLGYVIGLPGIAASELLANGFFGLKDTTTPLVTNTFALVTRYCLILLFLHMLSGIWVILAIPLATSASATADVVLMVAILLWRLRSKVKMDEGMLRLQRRRLYAQSREKASSVVSNKEYDPYLRR
jgi:putative peptidoglycan lipid II flippase